MVSSAQRPPPRDVEISSVRVRQTVQLLQRLLQLVLLGHQSHTLTLALWILGQKLSAVGRITSPQILEQSAMKTLLESVEEAELQLSAEVVTQLRSCNVVVRERRDELLDLAFVIISACETLVLFENERSSRRRTYPSSPEPRQDPETSSPHRVH